MYNIFKKRKCRHKYKAIGTFIGVDDKGKRQWQTIWKCKKCKEEVYGDIK